MALTGRFGSKSGRPYIEGQLVLPQFNITADLSLLLDTGADHTYLMPGDARALGLYGVELAPAAAPSFGAGGLITGDARAPAILLFSDATHLYVYEFELTIAAPNPAAEGIPSLLGRDVLDQWTITYSPATQVLSAEIFSCSIALPVSAGHAPAPWRRLE